MRDDRVKRGDKIAVWFSCGAASAVAAKATVDFYTNFALVRVVNNPVAEEHDDNSRFLSDVAEWIGQPIETATNNAYPTCSAVDVWAKRRFMSGPEGAPCTVELKRKAREQWEDANKPDWHVLGFTADETRRSRNFRMFERDNLLPVLIDCGLSKQNCYDYLVLNGIQPPAIYALGYPNANCIGCVKATSPTYWNHVRKTAPDVFAARAAQSREIGARLVRVAGERIFLDELDPSAKGAPLASMKTDCGIFCEERQ